MPTNNHHSFSISTRKPKKGEKLWRISTSNLAISDHSNSQFPCKISSKGIMAGSSKSFTNQRGREMEGSFPESAPLIGGSLDVAGYSMRASRYSVQTNSPSDGGHIRWYYTKAPLANGELAASVPRTEVLRRRDFVRLGVRDSLDLEETFLQKEEELLSYWWKEFAESREGPSIRGKPSVKLGKSVSACSSDTFLGKEDDRIGVPVKGGLYEVDLEKRHCFPVYWNGENLRVLRGHWFACKGGHWRPVREDTSEQLEVAYHNKVWHRRTFQESGLYAARVDLQGSTQGLHALFTGEDDTWEAWLNVDTSGFSSVFGLGGNGMRLRRGYAESPLSKPTQDELRQQKEEEIDDHCSQVPVRHLVFMIHGIGQRLEKSNLVDDVSDFRRNAVVLEQRHLTLHQRCAQRVLFIPCQWRKGLKLSSEAAVDEITLDGLRGLRLMLSATVHDVLYYMSPVHCQEIINSVSNQLNRLYSKFLRRHPGYDGKVSIFGHSLGSVLSFDILCHQDQEMNWLPSPEEPCTEECEIEQSSFDLDTQFGNVGFIVNDQIPDTFCSADQCMGSESSTSIHEKGLVDKDFTIVDIMEPRSTHTTLVDESADCSKNTLVDESAAQTTVADSAAELLKEASGPYPKVSDCKEAIAANESQVPTDNDGKTKLLNEEVDLLKTKIAVPEPQCSESGVKVKPFMLEDPSVKHRPSLSISGRLKNYIPTIKYPKLQFEVDTFFAVGSPLGLFLALRNIRVGIGHGQSYWQEGNIVEAMPACSQMLNLFHPFDPVAYRIEPLVCKEYVSMKPVIVPYHKGGRRLHIRFQELAEDVATRSRKAKHQFISVRDKVLTACQPKDSENSEDTEPSKEKSYGAIMLERLTGNVERIDHMLQDKTLEHQYLQAMGSHTNYWRDYDTTLFILRHLYKDVEDLETETSREQIR